MSHHVEISHGTVNLLVLLVTSLQILSCMIIFNVLTWSQPKGLQVNIDLILLGLIYQTGASLYLRSNAQSITSKCWHMVASAMPFILC